MMAVNIRMSSKRDDAFTVDGDKKCREQRWRIR